MRSGWGCRGCGVMTLAWPLSGPSTRSARGAKRKLGRTADGLGRVGAHNSTRRMMHTGQRALRCAREREYQSEVFC